VTHLAAEAVAIAVAVAVCRYTGQPVICHAADLTVGTAFAIAAR
jgi:hypothetical protein